MLISWLDYQDIREMTEISIIFSDTIFLTPTADISNRFGGDQSRLCFTASQILCFCDHADQNG